MPLLPRVSPVSRTTNSGRRSRRTASIFAALLAVVWLVESRDLAARAATGLASHLAAGLFIPALRAAFTLFLLALGLYLLDRISGRTSSVRTLLRLPSRSTASREWLLGTAAAWAAVILSVLPLVFSRALHSELWLQPLAWVDALIAVATAALSSLAIEAVFRGYSLARLSDALGPSWSTLLLSALYAAIASSALGTTRAVVPCFLFALLLSAAWHRTHALWLPWGLHFGWNLSLGLLFGLPTFDGGDLSSLVQSRTLGHATVAGSGFGPVAAPWTAIVLLLTIAALLPLTRDYAWHYTHPSIEPGGYPMEAQPPAAHAAMAASAPPPPLVQILPTPPPPPLPKAPGTLT